MKAWVFIALIGLTACGPAWKLRKAQRLINSAVAQGAKVKADTVFKTIHDTIPRLVVETDLFDAAFVGRDTLWRDSVRFIVQHDTIHHRIKEKISVMGPRIVRTIRVPYTVTKTIKAGVAKGWRTLGLVSLLLILIYIALRILKGYLKVQFPL